MTSSARAATTPEPSSTIWVTNGSIGSAASTELLVSAEIMSGKPIRGGGESRALDLDPLLGEIALLQSHVDSGVGCPPHLAQHHLRWLSALGRRLGGIGRSRAGCWRPRSPGTGQECES